MRAVRIDRSIALVLAILLGGCLPQAKTPIASPAASQVASPAASSPKTKTVTISIEGEPTPIRLSQFDDPDLATYVPEGFVPDATASDEGRAVIFYFDPTNVMDEEASVRIFFPSQGSEGVTPTTTPLSMEAYITETIRSYSESNGWEMLDRSDPDYAWAQTAVNYQKLGESSIAGTIYVGEHQGRRFTVITTFPLEYAEGFVPRANLILEDLKVKVR